MLGSALERRRMLVGRARLLNAFCVTTGAGSIPVRSAGRSDEFGCAGCARAGSSVAVKQRRQAVRCRQAALWGAWRNWQTRGGQNAVVIDRGGSRPPAPTITRSLGRPTSRRRSAASHRRGCRGCGHRGAGMNRDPGAPQSAAGRADGVTGKRAASRTPW